MQTNFMEWLLIVAWQNFLVIQECLDAARDLVVPLEGRVGGIQQRRALVERFRQRPVERDATKQRQVQRLAHCLRIPFEQLALVPALRAPVRAHVLDDPQDLDAEVAGVGDGLLHDVRRHLGRSRDDDRAVQIGNEAGNDRRLVGGGAGREVGEEKVRSEEHTSELQSPCNLVCRLLLEKKKKYNTSTSVT